MGFGLPGYLTTGLAVAAAAALAAPPTLLPPRIQGHLVKLTSIDTADSPLGDGTALMLGPSGIPIPPQSYVDKFTDLFLGPRDYTGTPQVLATPEGLYPETGVKSLELNPSVAQGEKTLDAAVLQQTAGGQIDAANPLVITGWSQSSTVESLAMAQLQADGVKTDDLHFVMLGDPSNPDGGLLERFDVPIHGQSPTIPSLGVTFSGATPDNLYPTDIYTIEYDGFADFPRYTIDPFSDLNAILGLVLEHEAYLGLTPQQIADATELPTSAADTMTNYYMIPAEGLPLLDPLQLIPYIGQPLYDLLEPDMSVLVDLGYGSIDDGWSQGDANVPTTFGLLPSGQVLAQVPEALVKGLWKGVTDAFHQLGNPDDYQYSLSTVEQIPFLHTLIESGFAAGKFDSTHPSLGDLLNALGGGSDATAEPTTLTGLVNEFSNGLANAYANLLPIADTFNALMTSLPAYDVDFFLQQLEAGNLLAAVGDPIAADVALVPFAISFGMLAGI